MATSVISVPGSLSTLKAASRDGSAPVLAPPPGREFSGGAKTPRSFASSRLRANERSREVRGGQVDERRARAASAGEPARDSEWSAGRRARSLLTKFKYYI